MYFLEVLTAQLPSIIFFTFSALLLVSAFLVVLNKNPIHSALWLILSFVSSAALWLLLYAEFLAITLILVYVGAVVVLFLFVLMMLDIDIESMRQALWKKLPLALLIGLILVVELVLLLTRQDIHISMYASPDLLHATDSNTRMLALELYTKYLLPFELAAVVLLLAIIAAISLTMRVRSEKKTQNIHDQVSVKANQSRVKLVSISPKDFKSAVSDGADQLKKD